jgi:hypothetical protein
MDDEIPIPDTPSSPHSPPPSIPPFTVQVVRTWQDIVRRIEADTDYPHPADHVYISREEHDQNNFYYDELRAGLVAPAGEWSKWFVWINWRSQGVPDRVRHGMYCYACSR